MQSDIKVLSPLKQKKERETFPSAFDCRLVYLL